MPGKSRVAFCIAIFLFFLPFIAFGRPLVVVTTGMIRDVVQNITGSKMEVKGLMGSGVDPHLYKATRSDMVWLRKADLVFYNGLFLEGRLEELFRALRRSGKRVFALGEMIGTQKLLKASQFGSVYDPHIWMDPLLWSEVAKVAANALKDYDPANSNVYQSNLDRYLLRLNSLHRSIVRLLSSVKEASRILVTSHDAFRYFGRRYGFKVIGIQGLSTDSESGVRDIERVVDVVVEHKLPAIFVETTISRKTIEAVVEGARAKGHTVKIGDVLYSDAMGAEGTSEGTYIGMIKHNARAIASALSGSTASDIGE